ncbi:uncharacterized protein LOC143033448 isoform X2 [Oratosquilla oratoria]|uniref:uncharacterized protein LOC143033448 isoform X2 n=1 Tax=Oratosquilla oratoria TaxID=337810 RepID=UPI003F76753E
MISVQELKEQAIALGLAGGDIGKYVIEQQAIEREEREKERRAKKEEIEHKTRLAEIEAEKAKIEAEREKAKIEAEREKAKIEAEKEKAKIEAEKELELARITATKQPTATPHDSVSRPQLPLLQEGEDIASYLNRFERIAELLKLSSDSYAVRLGTLLTGKAADMYISLSPEITKNYELLKKALLSGFNKTPDGYRVDFRNAKISPGETFLQFSFQLTRLFQAWLDSSEVGNTFNDLKDFMILDQFLSSLHPDLRAFIKERRPSTLTEAIRLADDWTSAHPNLPRTSIPNAKKFSRPPKPPKVTTVTPNPSSGRKDPPPLTCHGCGEIGHIRPRCPRNPRTFKEGTSTTQPYKVGFCLSDRTVPHFQASGTINGAWVSTIIRDTGCSCVVVSDEMLPDIDVPSCKKVYVADYLGRVDAFPLVSCYLRCPYYEGWTDVVRAPIKFASVLIGNVPGVKDPNISECSSPADDSAIPRPTQTATPSPKHLVCAVQTRAGKMKRIHPLALPALQPLSVTPDNFSLLQSSCETLSAARAKAASGEIDRTRNGSTYQFVKTDGLLYRKCLTSNRPDKVGKSTLVVPRDCRPVILSIAHESPLAGHFSHRKTELKVAEQFYWPGMGTDIRTFCRSCDKCQRFSAKGRVPPVPLQPMPIVTEPFARVAIDLVGPLSPASSDGHRYILTLIDFATGFPEAVPLKDIDSISVAEALLTIFSRVGIPREILSDRGTQFTSNLMKELHRMLGVKPIFTTPFHPSGNGRIERLHGPLKAILRKLCAEKPREWHRYLIPTLFALRELPSDRTGFSAFELLYGRSVRGPLTVLRDLWENRTLHEEERSSFQYVIELQDKLAECSQMAAQQADISSSRYKAYFDLKSQNRQFKPGDEVLVLLPSDTSKLLVTWNGPYNVLERRGEANYVIETPRGQRLYHANILKRYHRRAQVQQLELMDEISAIEELSAPGKEKVSIVDEGDPCDLLSQLPLTPDGMILSPSTDKPEVGQLAPDQLVQLQILMGEYKDVFSDEPGCTSTITHDIQLTTTDRVQAKVYPVPIHLRPVFEKEVETLFRQGIIQRSSSPHSSPVVMASDYTGPLSDLLRKTSPEPLPWTEDLLDRFCHLKAAISSQPILRLPDPKLTFVLRTDASLYGLGAVLLQYHDECPHPVAYASRKLLDREKRYSTIERECLAVVFSISRFDYYLRGKEFVLEVDHKPLLYLATFKGKNDRLLRWALALQAYKFRVVHIAGKDNLGADLLSRS